MDYHQVDIDPAARIAKNASIVGQVSIAADCTVLFNATLRGDDAAITIGAGSNVQENCCIHVRHGSPCTIGENVTIGHGAIVHGSTVCDGSLIGMGSIVLDDAVVGKNCLIGAGSLVTGGTVIPDGMLAMGSPAKPKRALTSEEIESLAASAQEYVEVGADMVANGILFVGDSIPRNLDSITLKPA